MTHQKIVTVQPMVLESVTGKRKTAGILKLRGRWLAAIFPPSTRVLVTREWRNEAIVLVLEKEPVT